MWARVLVIFAALMGLIFFYKDIFSLLGGLIKFIIIDLGAFWFFLSIYLIYKARGTDAVFR